MGEYGQVRRRSRRAARCGLFTALAVVILALGGMIPFAGIACPMLAMLCLLPAVCEEGPKWAMAQYVASAVLGMLLCADQGASLLYAFLGWYPALRPRLERLGKLTGLLVKAGIFCLSLTAMYGVILFLLQMEAAVAEFAGYSAGMIAALLAMGCAVFLLYDRTMGVLMEAYCRRRKRRYG